MNRDLSVGLALLSVGVFLAACSRQSDLSSPQNLAYVTAANNVAVLVGAPCALPESGFSGVANWSPLQIRDVKKKKSCTGIDEANITQNFRMMDQSLTALRVSSRKYAFASLQSTHVNVNYVMQQTQAAAEQLSADGTFIWYFAGHSSKTHFGLKSERFRIGDVMDAIKRGAGSRLKRLVVILDTCYASRVIDGNDPIDLAPADTVPANFNVDLQAAISSHFGANAPEIIVAVASQRTGYSYFNAGGSAYTTAIRDVTRQLQTNVTVTIEQWLRKITDKTVMYAAQVGLDQRPAFAFLPQSVGSDNVFGAGHTASPPPTNTIPQNVTYRHLQNITVNQSFNGYMLYPQAGESVRVVRLIQPNIPCVMTRIPQAISVFTQNQVATAYDRVQNPNSKDIYYVGSQSIAADYIRVTGMSTAGACQLKVELGN